MKETSDLQPHHPERLRRHVAAHRARTLREIQGLHQKEISGPGLSTRSIKNIESAAYRGSYSKRTRRIWAEKIGVDPSILDITELDIGQFFSAAPQGTIAHLYGVANISKMSQIYKGDGSEEDTITGLLIQSASCIVFSNYAASVDASFWNLGIKSPGTLDHFSILGLSWFIRSHKIPLPTMLGMTAELINSYRSKRISDRQSAPIERSPYRPAGDQYFEMSYIKAAALPHAFARWLKNNENNIQKEGSGHLRLSYRRLLGSKKGQLEMF